MKRALIGLQWGDEGKGKLVTYYVNKNSGSRLYVARYNGADNAGHTIFTPRGDEIVTHLLPSGIVSPNTYNAMLGGMYVDPLTLMEEIQNLQNRGYDITPVNLGVSGLAHVTLEYHIRLEKFEEMKRGSDAIGTTKKGVGPTAVDKYGRCGVRFSEFLNPDSFGKLMSVWKNGIGFPAFYARVDEYPKLYAPAQEFLSQFSIDETELHRDSKGEDWLYEGAQAVLLDIDFGSYPFVTSSHVARPPADTDETVGVAKAYVTRVGGGPFPTRMDFFNESGIRGVKGITPGAEYGATTGRPRSCGWFDVPAARYAVAASGTDKIALTKLDVLGRLPALKICTHYDCNGETLHSVPANRFDFVDCKPVYKSVEGWCGQDFSNVRTFSDLPRAAQDYVELLEELVECPIKLVSVGPRAEQTIER